MGTSTEIGDELGIKVGNRKAADCLAYDSGGETVATTHLEDVDPTRKHLRDEFVSREGEQEGPWVGQPPRSRHDPKFNRTYTVNSVVNHPILRFAESPIHSHPSFIYESTGKVKAMDRTATQT